MSDIRSRLADWFERKSFTAEVLSRTGVLGALSPKGVVSFARDIGRKKLRGRDAALVLHAANTPHKIALASSSVRLTYSELEQQVQSAACALFARGVKARDRVAIMMPNCAETVVVQATLLRLGGVAVQVGYRLKAPEVAYILANSEPSAIVYHHSFADTMRGAIAKSGTKAVEIVVGGNVPGAESWIDIATSAPDAGVLPTTGENAAGNIVYTSGTTGKPKGANREYKPTDLIAVGDMMRQVGICHRDRHLVLCPLYHSAAPVFVGMMFAVGGSVHVADRFDPEKTLETIERERITSAFMVPTMLARLCSLPATTRAKYDTSSLKWIMNGAAPLPTETAKQFQDSFGQILWNFYGATETGLVSLAGPSDHGRRPGTVGRLLRGSTARILDDKGHTLPPGEIGELWIKNDMIISGYHKNEKATQDSTLDGYFSVGDLARMDEDGYLYLASRKHDMIISGGVNVYPREIEDRLLTHPAVADVAVVGVPHSDWGEAICAFVVAAPGEEPTLEDLVSHCREALADYKSPRRLEFLDELPRNPTGKVDKKKLRECAA